MVDRGWHGPAQEKICNSVRHAVGGREQLQPELLYINVCHSIHFELARLNWFSGNNRKSREAFDAALDVDTDDVCVMVALNMPCLTQASLFT